MPWTTRKNPKGGYDIIRSDTGEKVGHSSSKAKAEASVRARYAAEPAAKKKRKK